MVLRIRIFQKQELTIKKNIGHLKTLIHNKLL
jgi:hypothetical protein